MVGIRTWLAGVGSIAFSAVALACGPSVVHSDDDDEPSSSFDASRDALVVDAGPSDLGDAPPEPENGAVFAHTSSALYRVDPDTLAISLIGGFTGDAAFDMMTDIAIDSDGEMIGVSFDRIYRIDSETAVTTRVGNTVLPQLFNGLSYVPSELAFGVAGPDVLVGTRASDGKVFQINPTTGALTEIGDMGAYSSSGDIVAVAGFGIVATVVGSGVDDLLVRLAPSTFAATPIGTGTGFSDLWGIGFWRGDVYGFGADGRFARINTTTGVGTLVTQSGSSWWGAAVTTIAPVIP